MANTGNVAFSGTLTAGTAMAVTLTQARDSVRVTNTAGTTGIYFTVASDGATPTTATVGGADCYVVPPVVGASQEVGCGFGPVNLSIISAGAVSFTVDCDHLPGQ